MEQLDYLTPLIFKKVGRSIKIGGGWSITPVSLDERQNRDSPEKVQFFREYVNDVTYSHSYVTVLKIKDSTFVV